MINLLYLTRLVIYVSAELLCAPMRCNLELWRLLWYDTQPDPEEELPRSAPEESPMLVCLNCASQVDDTRFRRINVADPHRQDLSSKHYGRGSQRFAKTCETMSAAGMQLRCCVVSNITIAKS